MRRTVAWLLPAALAAAASNTSLVADVAREWVVHIELEPQNVYATRNDVRIQDSPLHVEVLQPRSAVRILSFAVVGYCLREAIVSNVSPNHRTAWTGI
jgi:hypothetical protein